MSGDLSVGPSADQRVQRCHTAVICDAPFGQSAVGAPALHHTMIAGTFGGSDPPIG